MPPDHSTAASGTLPTEQTKTEHRDDRPDEGAPDRLHERGGVSEEQRIEEAVAELSDKAGQQEADRDLLPQHLPVAAEVVGDIGPGGG